MSVVGTCRYRYILIMQVRSPFLLAYRLIKKKKKKPNPSIVFVWPLRHAPLSEIIPTYVTFRIKGRFVLFSWTRKIRTRLFRIPPAYFKLKPISLGFALSVSVMFYYRLFRLSSLFQTDFCLPRPKINPVYFELYWQLDPAKNLTSS